MKKILVSIVLASLIFTACSNDDDSTTNEKAEIPFTGTWERQFEAGPGNQQTASYFVYQDSIRYTLVGAVGNADYLMERDTFLIDNNRFIGHTDDAKYYLIFVKNENSDSITLYKQEVESITEGLSTEVPDDDTTEGHGWNTYYNQ